MRISIFTDEHEWWLYDSTSVTEVVHENIEAPSGLTFLCSAQSGVISGVCRASSAGRASTFYRRVRFEAVEQLEPVRLQELQTGIKGNAQKNIDSVTRAAAGKFSTAAGNHVLATVAESTTGNADAIERTRNSGSSLPKWVLGANPETRAAYVTERDAVLGALFIAGFDRDVFEEVGEPAEPDHLLASVNEDPMVVADTLVFADWIKEKDLSVGGATFTSKDQTRHLTILNTNRATIENTVGVDMLLYVEEFDAFTLIQYKRLDEGGIYRPTGDQLAKQLHLMNEISTKSQAATPSSALNAHRLGSEFLFMKLCSSKQPTEVTSLTRGMYIGLGWWDQTVNHEATTGSQGGNVLGFDTVPRYLSNTEFAQLVGNGWIGSNSDEIRDYLRELVGESYGNSHAVFLASLGLGGDRRPPRQDSASRV